MLPRMRTIGTAKQLVMRRQRALRLLEQGQSTAAVAHSVGVSQRSVQRWRQQSSEPPKKRQPTVLGRPPRLSATQLKQLKRVLERGAYAHGYAEDYWTLDRIAQLVWQMFRVRYHQSAVWHLLRRLGWSCQKPQRVAQGRDDEAVAHWLRYTWKRIKKVA